MDQMADDSICDSEKSLRDYQRLHDARLAEDWERTREADPELHDLLRRTAALLKGENDRMGTILAHISASAEGLEVLKHILKHGVKFAETIAAGPQVAASLSERLQEAEQRYDEAAEDARKRDDAVAAVRAWEADNPGLVMDRQMVPAVPGALAAAQANGMLHLLTTDLDRKTHNPLGYGPREIYAHSIPGRPGYRLHTSMPTPRSSWATRRLVVTPAHLDELVKGLQPGGRAPDDRAAALEELARWLVSMDDVEGPGVAERRIVTMSRIIDRARQALGG